MVVQQRTQLLGVPSGAEELRRDATSAYVSSLNESPARIALQCLSIRTGIPFNDRSASNTDTDIRALPRCEILGVDMLVLHDSRIERLSPRVECDQCLKGDIGSGKARGEPLCRDRWSAAL